MADTGTKGGIGFEGVWGFVLIGALAAIILGTVIESDLVTGGSDFGAFLLDVGVVILGASLIMAAASSKGAGDAVRAVMLTLGVIVVAGGLGFSLGFSF